VDTLDWALDVLAPADLAGWTVKDEDDLAQLQLLRVLDDDDLARLHVARERVEAALATRNFPFSGEWAEWRPPPGGVPALTLPPEWDVVEAAPRRDVRGRSYRSGRNGRLLDADGNIWLDLDLAAGTLLHGHAHPVLVEAISRQARLGLGAGMDGPTAPSRALAEALGRRTPGWESVVWAESGSHALQLATRLVRRATGRSLVAVWSPPSDDPDLLYLPADPAGARVELLAARDRLAGVVVEGLTLFGSTPAGSDAAGAGAVWRSLRAELLRLASAGTILVADERRTLGAAAKATGTGGHAGLDLGGQFDLVVHGPVLFGGLTGGALCGRDGLLDELGAVAGSPPAERSEQVRRSIHPVLAAAALATLQLATPAALDDLARRATRLRSALDVNGFGPAARLPAVLDVAGLAARRVRIDADGWAWLSTATDDDDVNWAIEALGNGGSR
jgi:hypothetical protein